MLKGRADYENLASMASLRLVAESSCFALSIHDPAFALLQLCHDPSGPTSQVVRDESSNALAVKSAVVDQIQKRIGEADHSDATVAAIACLVCYEVSTHDLFDLNTSRTYIISLTRLFTASSHRYKSTETDSETLSKLGVVTLMSFNVVCFADCSLGSLYAQKLCLAC